MRIDKLLANSGFGSRKDVKKLLKSGAVLCNEKKITDAKAHVDPEQDQIMAHGELVEYRQVI